jgi:hypothetical protein
MTVACWVNETGKGRGGLRVDHAERMGERMGAGWQLDIDPYNTNPKNGMRSSIAFHAVAADGTPFSVLGEQPQLDLLAHWAMVYSRAENSVTLYCNGRAIIEKAAPEAGLIPAKSTARVYVRTAGAELSCDELARWGRALSAHELAAVARFGALPIPTTLTARSSRAVEEIPKLLEGIRQYWPFDEGKGTRLGDALNTGSAAVMIGNAAWTEGCRGAAAELSRPNAQAGKPRGELAVLQGVSGAAEEISGSATPGNTVEMARAG